MTREIVYVRLPFRSEYLPVLRSMAGVVGGVTSLGFDQIMHLRLAVSEVFEFASRRIPLSSARTDSTDLECSFAIGPDKLEVLITPPSNLSVQDWGPEDEESLALLRSLMNVVEIDVERNLVRLVKQTPITRV